MGERRQPKRVVKQQRRLASAVVILSTTTVIFMVLAFVLFFIAKDAILRDAENNNELSNESDVTIVDTPSIEDENPIEVETDAPETELEVPAVVEKPKIEFEYIDVNNLDVAKGNLIVVNSQYPYNFDIKTYKTELYGNRTKVYQLSNSSLSLDNKAFKALDKFLVDYVDETGCKDVLVNTAYRTLEQQESILNTRIEKVGEEEAYKYVAKPGHSEHHTGLAVDMCLFIDGEQHYFHDHENGKWIIDNAVNYGFTLRYTEENKSITGCEAEPWHYRYVGVVHANLMEKKNYCLEEYTTYLCNFSADGSDDTTKNQIIWVKDDFSTEVITVGSEIPESGYLIYFVRTNPDGDKTSVPIISYFKSKSDSYEISGNNMNGFIVTIDLSK